MACPSRPTSCWEKPSGSARGHLQLQPDQVQGRPAAPGRALGRAGHHDDGLGDRVLDLQPGVHLEEVRLAGAPVGVRVEQELDGAGVHVAHVPGERDGRLGDHAAYVVADGRGGCLLQHLLVPALGGAVALVQVHDVAVGVGEDLHLDVAPVLDVPLDQQGVVAERGERLALGRGHRLGELGLGAHDAHALAATAGRGLDQHRERHLAEAVGAVARDGPAGHHGDTGLDGDLAGGVLAAHPVHHLADGPTNVSPASSTARAKAARSERKP